MVADEPFGVLRVGVGEDGGPLFVDGVGAAVVDVCGGVCMPIPEWRWVWLYQPKNQARKARASSRLPNQAGNSGRYFNVLKWDSE